MRNKGCLQGLETVHVNKKSVLSVDNEQNDQPSDIELYMKDKMRYIFQSCNGWIRLFKTSKLLTLVSFSRLPKNTNKQMTRGALQERCMTRHVYCRLRQWLGGNSSAVSETSRCKEGNPVLLQSCFCYYDNYSLFGLVKKKKKKKKILFGFFFFCCISFFLNYSLSLKFWFS